MQLAPMAKDITYFITAKPYLSSRTQQILDLFILFNLKSQNFLSPVSLMSLISLVNNFSQGGTAVKIPNGHALPEETKNYDPQDAKEVNREIIEAGQGGNIAPNLESEF